MKLSECIKQIQVRKGKDIFPFFVPAKIISQIKIHYFPSSDFPISGWSVSESGHEILIVYLNQIYLMVDRFGLVHDVSLERDCLTVACS